jgi:hypothetical protein
MRGGRFEEPALVIYRRLPDLRDETLWCLALVCNSLAVLLVAANARPVAAASVEPSPAV